MMLTHRAFDCAVRLAYGVAVVLLAAQVDAAAQTLRQAHGADAGAARAVLTKYCVTCHNERLKTGDLVLEKLDVTRPNGNPEIWEKVILKVRSGAMPPTNAARPDRASLVGLASWLETSLDRAAAAEPNPGRPVVHRLNRAEYTNAVRDLLGIEIDGRALLPADDASYGFDNIAAVLTVTQELLERYLLAAKKISRLAVGDPSIRANSETYKVPMALLQEDRMSEDLPFGSRGGLAVRHVFPVDGEYEIRLKLHRNSINLAYAIRGLDEDNLINVHVDGVRVRQFSIPALQSVGNPLLGTRGQGYDANTMEQGLAVRVPVKAGSRVVGISLPRRHWYVEGVGVARLPAASDGFNSGVATSTKFGKIELAVHTVEITGPFNGRAPTDTLSRERIFTCLPFSDSLSTRGATVDKSPEREGDKEEVCARAILSRLARRAYRRPPTTDDIAVLIAFYKEGRQEGTFEDGVTRALERMLMSPYFLMRKAQDPPTAAPGSVYRISDLELASRLSFFLWSSIPDDQLLDLAERGRLKEPAVLEQEVRRMLRDPRFGSFVSNFFGQWLYLRNIDSHQPDQKIYPEFDENLGKAFKQETRFFLESQIREDRSVTELLTAAYTFLNERLARHYGVPNVYGSHFRRVSLPKGPRAGLLGHGSVLTVTSYPDRTSPVLRGKWLLENLLGAPPPPPPANVPPFPSNDGAVKPRSVRERMEQHRRNPACATCHSRIDPLGFALENFDGIGQYRTLDDGSPVDASGTLPDGTKFNGPAEFRQALLAQKDELNRSLAEKLLTYALGRGLEHYDMPSIRRITRETAAGDNRWSSLIMSIVKSVPFQMRAASVQ